MKINIKWSSDGIWNYINNKNEQINLWFFIGTVVPSEKDVKLFQIVIYKLVVSIGWNTK